MLAFADQWHMLRAARAPSAGTPSTARLMLLLLHLLHLRRQLCLVILGATEANRCTEWLNSFNAAITTMGAALTSARATRVEPSLPSCASEEGQKRGGRCETWRQELGSMPVGGLRVAAGATTTRIRLECCCTPWSLAWQPPSLELRCRSCSRRPRASLTLPSACA